MIDQLRSLHQPNLLVLRLAPLTPLWCFILASLFLCIALCLGLMYCTRVMFSRGVYGDYFEWRVSDIQKLVLSASWDYDDIVLFDLLFLPSNNCLASAMGEYQHLIDGMNLEVMVNIS